MTHSLPCASGPGQVPGDVPVPAGLCSVPTPGEGGGFLGWLLGTVSGQWMPPLSRLLGLCVKEGDPQPGSSISEPLRFLSVTKMDSIPV